MRGKGALLAVIWVVIQIFILFFLLNSSTTSISCSTRTVIYIPESEFIAEMNRTKRLSDSGWMMRHHVNLLLCGRHKKIYGEKQKIYNLKSTNQKSRRIASYLVTVKISDSTETVHVVVVEWNVMNVEEPQWVSFRPDLVLSFDYHQDHLAYLQYHQLLDVVLREVMLMTKILIVSWRRFDQSRSRIRWATSFEKSTLH